MANKLNVGVRKTGASINTIANATAIIEVLRMEISDWQKTITLLVQDGNEVKLGEKKFTMIDPYEVARTHGFLKYKLLKRKLVI